ncbi:MAG: energy transducer TonB [Candidatus Poribacteria bacterium]|nr:energy transducer TonB [Candidatus Poribacteria bacterium]
MTPTVGGATASLPLNETRTVWMPQRGEPERKSGRYSTAFVISVAIHATLAFVLSFVVIIQREEIVELFSPDMVVPQLQTPKPRVIRARPTPQPIRNIAPALAFESNPTWATTNTPPTLRTPTNVRVSTDAPSSLVQGYTDLPPEQIRVQMRDHSNTMVIQNVDMMIPQTRMAMDAQSPDQLLPGLSSFLLGTVARNGAAEIPPDYWKKIQSAIQRNHRYPRFARDNGIQGTAMVRFTLHRDGTISGLEVVDSARHQTLDAAAIGAIQRAAPFPAFPNDQTVEQYVIQVPITFELTSDR